jgi:hypothetical protein
MIDSLYMPGWYGDETRKKHADDVLCPSDHALMSVACIRRIRFHRPRNSPDAVWSETLT